MPIPFIPIIIVAASVVTEFLGIGIKKGWWSKGKTEITLGVLGYAGSGKTELFHRISGKSRENNMQTVNPEDVPLYTINRGNKKITFLKSKDYPGDKSQIRDYFEESIKGKSNFLILFNIQKILNRDMNELGYLKHVYTHLENNEKVIYIGSFLDKINTEINTVKIKKILSQEIKDFRPKNEILLVDLTNNVYKDKILDKLFSE